MLRKSTGKRTWSRFLFCALGLTILLAGKDAASSFADGCATAQFGGNPASFTVGTAPRSMVNGDFNHDGQIDLAVANYGTQLTSPDGGISVLLNDGQGGFMTATNIPAGVNPRSIVLADFNEDSNLDLAVLNYVSGNCCISTVATILRGDGAGSFAAVGAPFDVGSDASSLITGDFNGDANVDLAATVLGSGVGRVAVLLGNGGGGFSSPMNYLAGGQATSIATGDFNSDGKPDLVTSNLNGFNISILLGDGLGAFAAPVSFSVGGNPQFVAVGDLNQDSKLDVVTALTNHNVSVVSGNGDGTFGAATLFAVGSFPLSVLIRDLNSDGKLDVATANTGAGTASVLIGDGNGSFAPTANYFADIGSHFVVSSDFNGDGMTDLAVANVESSNVSVLSGKGSGAFAGARTYNAGLIPLSVGGGDFNADGKVDLAVANAGQNSISVFLGAGSGLFGTDVKYLSGFSPKDVIVEDFNNDGKLDAAVANGACCPEIAVSVLLGNGNGGFGAPQHFPAGTNASAIVSADFNKDGNADLAVVNNADNNFSVLIGNGNGAFSAPANTSVLSTPADIATGDVNGDGNSDLIVASFPISVFLGNGIGGFLAGATIPVPNPNSVAIGDINGDGLADVAVASDAGNLSVVRGDGAGGFSAPLAFTVASPSNVAFADLNGDGKTDLTASSGSSDVGVLLGDGAGTFGAATYFPVGRSPRGILPIDLNEDGRTDLAIASFGDYLSVLLNTCPAAPVVRPSVSIGDTTVTEGNSGQTNASFVVSLSAISSETVTVSYYSTSQSATSGVDFQSVSGHLTFSPGVTSQTISVPINGDLTIEPNEDFTVFLSNPLNTQFANRRATGRILNDDVPPGLLVSDATVTEGDSGMVNAVFTVTLREGPVGGNVTATARTFSSSAHVGSDFQNVSSDLIFTPGETTKTVSVPVVGDVIYEASEIFTLELMNVVGAPIVDGVGVGTILDNDPQPTLSVSDATIIEGDSGMADLIFTISVSGQFQNQVSVALTLSNGTAVEQEDFNGVSAAPLFVGGGVTTATVRVPIVGDTITEPNETFFANLSNPNGATISDGQGVGTIINDESASESPTIQFTARQLSVPESGGSLVLEVSRSGILSAPATVEYVTRPVTGSGTSDRSDYTAAFGTFRFAAGESSRTLTVFITDDVFVEGNEPFEVVLSNPTGGASLGSPATAVVLIVDNDTSPPSSNPVDLPNFFVRQHYVDFFSREPDAAGLAFWTNQITECGTDTACIEIRRINVSAAFFLSIEFRQTGYLVYRMYKAAYGNLPGAPVPLRFNEFLPDTQQIGLGVVVGRDGWEQVLENNKNQFAADFVGRTRFATAYPTTLTPAEFVDALFANAGVTPTGVERQAAINEFGGAGNTANLAARGRALRLVAENPTLEQQEFNKAFVLMQYLGYLRRNPNDAPDGNFDGYNFWLGKLNQFNGNFINAEMVKAFILSGEYRQRFGP